VDEDVSWLWYCGYLPGQIDHRKWQIMPAKSEHKFKKVLPVFRLIHTSLTKLKSTVRMVTGNYYYRTSGWTRTPRERHQLLKISQLLRGINLSVKSAKRYYTTLPSGKQIKLTAANRRS
jgi:hypothetical protein